MTFIIDGFTLPQNTKEVTDIQLLSIDKEMLLIMMSKLSHIQYQQWRLNVLRNVLIERVDADDENAQLRVNKTQYEILKAERFLKLFGDKEKVFLNR